MELEESEPETEVWEEVEENVLDDIEPPDFADQDSLELSASKSNVYAMWIINFIMVMQAVFRLSDAAIEKLLFFLKTLFSIMGQQVISLCEVVQHLPSSVYKIKQLLHVPNFHKFVVCRKCNFYTNMVIALKELRPIAEVKDVRIDHIHFIHGLV